MRTPHPEPISQLAGTRQVIETATKVTGPWWGDEGSSRVQHAWTADPGIARRLATGQAGYITAGGCAWVHVARPRLSPLTCRPRPSERVTIHPPRRPSHDTTGSMVLVSAMLPSNASTISGNPAWSASSPMVICGSRRRSLENPLSGTRPRRRSRSTGC